jgi:hypothetical protein
MGETVRIPDPVYSKASREAERQDVARGVVIREWMEKAEKFDEMEVRR